MTYIKLIACSILLLLSTSFSFAQRDLDMNNPKIEQLRIAFYTEQIKLTAAEAQQFWPLYNEYNKEMRMLKGKSRLKMQEIKLSLEGASEPELEQLADELIALRVQESKLFEEYYPKFKRMLPIEKVLRFYKAEQEFPKVVLRKLRQTQMENNPNRGRRGRMSNDWD